MKNPALRFASAVGLIITACMSTGINASSPDPELQEIAGYRQWHRLTDKPVITLDGVAGG